MLNRPDGYQKDCRICGNKEFTSILDLGFSPPCDAFLNKEQLKEQEISYPTEIRICKICSLVQLNYVVPPEILFQRDYPYDMSFTKTGGNHFESIGNHIKNKFKLEKGNLAVDIGSNSGLLLSGFKNAGFNVLGVEPAPNMFNEAIKNGIDTINDFYNNSSSKKIIELKGRPKIITATNVFAHINDIKMVVSNIESILDDKGILIIEAPYLLDLFRNVYYDTIYHEHLSYLSLKPLKILFNKFGLEIFDVEKIEMHGGSYRYFIARKGDYAITKELITSIKIEDNNKLYDNITLQLFKKSVRNHQIELLSMLTKLKNQRKIIAGISAPAKGTALLNYCGIGPLILDFITELSPFKIGKYTPGTHIPVIDDEMLIEKMPDYALLLAWNFAEPIMVKLNKYKEKGGKFIIPIPKPRIV